MFDIPSNFLLKKCSKCGLVFIDPQPFQKALKKHYPSKSYYAYRKTGKKGVFEILREYLVMHYYSPNLLSKFISTFIKNVPAMPSKNIKGKILDLGCGTGDTLVLLKKLGWETYGIDMDKNALFMGKRKGLKNLRLGTYQALSKYPDSFFDAIRLYHVIEHIDDPVKCVRLIKRKLKKNGELIIGTPNADSLLSFLFKKDWYNLDSPRHLFIFSPKTLKRLIKSEKMSAGSAEFYSAGGLPGSLQYYIEDKFGKKIDLIHKLPAVLLLYPLEWFLDKIKLGDVFTIKAIKR